MLETERICLSVSQRRSPHHRCRVLQGRASKSEPGQIPVKPWHFSVSPYLYLVDTQNISTFSSGFLNFNSYTVEPKTMKKVIGSICLALFCLGVIGVEYEIASYFGSMLILFASVAFLGALLIAVFRAPEGYEWLDGFHICQRDPASRHVRSIRLFRRARAARSR